MSLLNHRTRGFRTINVVFCALLAATAVTVLLAKAYAGREVRDIARTERSIGEENKRIRLLKAEVAHLEQPERLQRLSKALLGMAPLSATREGDINSLPAIAAGYAPPTPIATPTAPEVQPEEVPGIDTPAPVAAEVVAPVAAPVANNPAETGQ
ncbi:MAG: cell division protein [Caulobacter sp.]|nr:cell division protein [Caulobacter sp.]